MNTPHYCGIITNYVCTAACRHCMFASSPSRPKDFITPDMSEHLASLLGRAGASSVHIGGGEPFMNFDALCSLIEALNRHGIGVDYIETNAFWCKDEDFVRARLNRLKTLGVDTVMASVDPFHIEFVPLCRPLLLCRLLRETGFDYFIWKERYLRKFRDFDITKVYTHDELKELLGENYVTETAAEYGIGVNGRALVTAAGELYSAKKAIKLADRNGCRDLSEPFHCHFDLYGNAVPSGCPGIAVEAEDYLSGNYDRAKYPVFSRLYNGGTMALYEYAKEKGFAPKDGYPTKCAFCYDMREYLAQNAPSADLAPMCYYNEMKKSCK